MNSLIDTSFCSTINSSYEAATNIVNYLTHLGDPSMDTINAVYKGVGLGTSTTENFSSSTFYDFWKINDNPQILGNIISQVSVPKTSPSNSYNTRYDLCKLTRSYNQTVLQGFFCNEIENTGTYPILGEEINENSLQFNNIHSYLRSEPDLGGTGLEACTDPSGANNNLNPVLEDFCLSSFPDSISSSEQSLYISSNQDIYKWCGCYVNPTGFSVSMGQNSKICNPLCTYQETIKSFSRPDAGATNLVTDSCIQTICAIDQVSIKSVDNEGNINFSQICPGCKEGGNCTCVIDSSVQGILDKIRTGQEGTQSLASFKQVCPNANCYISEATGGYTPITCNTNNPSNTNKDPVLGYSGNGFLRNISEEEKFTTTNYVVLIVFCLIFIFYSLFSLLAIEGVSIYEFISSRYATKHRPNFPKGSYGNAKDPIIPPTSRVRWELGEKEPREIEVNKSPESVVATAPALIPPTSRVRWELGEKEPREIEVNKSPESVVATAPVISPVEDLWTNPRQEIPPRYEEQTPVISKQVNDLRKQTETNTKDIRDIKKKLDIN